MAHSTRQEVMLDPCIVCQEAMPDLVRHVKCGHMLCMRCALQDANSGGNFTVKHFPEHVTDATVSLERVYVAEGPALAALELNQMHQVEDDQDPPQTGSLRRIRKSCQRCFTRYKALDLEQNYEALSEVEYQRLLKLYKEANPPVVHVKLPTTAAAASLLLLRNTVPPPPVPFKCPGCSQDYSTQPTRFLAHANRCERHLSCSIFHEQREDFLRHYAELSIEKNVSVPKTVVQRYMQMQTDQDPPIVLRARDFQDGQKSFMKVVNDAFRNHFQRDCCAQVTCGRCYESYWRIKDIDVHQKSGLCRCFVKQRLLKNQVVTHQRLAGKCNKLLQTLWRKCVPIGETDLQTAAALFMQHHKAMQKWYDEACKKYEPLLPPAPPARPSAARSSGESEASLLTRQIEEAFAEATGLPAGRFILLPMEEAAAAAAGLTDDTNEDDLA